MPSSDLTDVLVIGAGPVGLTLAAELHRHGARVRLVEKRAEPIQHPNAAIVHVRTLEILSAMGAVDGFLREGYAFPGIHIRTFGKKLGFLDLSGVDSPYPTPRTISQQITERLLNEHVVHLGGRVERQVEAIALEQDADEVRVRLRYLAEGDREETARARWVVGCEGAASMTRDALAIPFTGERYTGKEFLQTDAYVRWSYPHGFGYQFMTEEQVVVLLAYNDKGLYRIICARNDRDPENHLPPTLEEMQTIVRANADPTAELVDPVWFNRFRTGHRFASSFRKGRAFLAGDAGHVHIPIGGQGMNYGMHDAFNLAWKLAAVAKGEAHPELLETYMEERHPVDEALIRGTDRGFQYLVNPPPGLRTALKLLGPTLVGLEDFQQRVRETLAEVNVAYPTSDLSEDRGGSSGPAAGERAPDALVVQMPARATMRLFEVLRGTCWHLFLFAGTQPTPAQIESMEKLTAGLTGRWAKFLVPHLVLCDDPPLAVTEAAAQNILMDREQFAHAKYGVDGIPCLYLIRPDGYVGFRGALAEAEHLTAYLEGVFVT